MDISRNLKGSFGLIAVVVSLLATMRTQGMNLITYDLDSLVYMSSTIVEGQLGGTEVISNFTASKFKISSVYKGDFKAAQFIDITALDFYRVRDEPLKEGDQLFLFLSRAVGDGLFYNIPRNAEIYWPAPSGVRLVRGENVLGFWQPMNPGPYEAVLNPGRGRPNCTVAKFREQIRECVTRVDPWRRILDQKPATNNVAALIQILRQRPSIDPEGAWEQDFISDKICQTLASLHDFDALLDAATIVGYRWHLSFGFRSPAGRAFLRKQIADGHALVGRKILCANLLAVAGDGAPPEWHLKHIAELAAQPKQDPKLQVALLNSMHQMAHWRPIPSEGTNAESAGLEDQKEAGAILTRLAGKTDSEEVKYEIDLVLPSLGSSPLSSRNCLLRSDGYDPATRKLKLRCRISGVARA